MWPSSAGPYRPVVGHSAQGGDPATDVVVAEQKIAGYGASGRNGGFALTMVGRSLHDLVRKVGTASARATRLALRALE